MKQFLVFLSVLAMFTLPALSDDFENIPKAARSKIKSRCVSQFPDDYFMQDGCISLQSKSYLKVHGSQNEGVDTIPQIDVTGIPSGFDRMQLNNSAYLSVVHKICKIGVGKMPEQYRERAVASDRLNASEVDNMISGLVEDFLQEAKLDPRVFCVKAKKNFQNFVSDLKS